MLCSEDRLERENFGNKENTNFESENQKTLTSEEVMLVGTPCRTDEGTDGAKNHHDFAREEGRNETLKTISVINQEEGQALQNNTSASSREINREEGEDTLYTCTGTEEDSDDHTGDEKVKRKRRG